MPGVTVTVESAALQGPRTTVTSANGDFIIPFLPPGEYTVTFEIQGLMAAGLVLFALTLVVNLAANAIVRATSRRG